mgnify:CR=1 FL=1
MKTRRREDKTIDIKKEFRQTNNYHPKLLFNHYIMKKKNEKV